MSDKIIAPINPAKSQYILIVSDIENSGALVEILTIPGYRVQYTQADKKVLDIMEEELPDLVILDIQRPSAHGFELCQAIISKDTTKNIPIIIICTLPELHDKEKAFELGCYDLITKPFSAVEVLARIKNCLLVQQYQKQLEEKVQERTVKLEEMNIALTVLLKKRDKDKNKLEENIFTNYKALISPLLLKLKNSLTRKDQQILIGIVESNLKEFLQPFSQKLSDPKVNFTPAEIQIASFIKQGITTKEIAQALNCSPRTIDTHRDNIRKKLNIKNKNINLRSFLLNL